MAKNSREGNRERAARRRGELLNRGVEQFQVIAPPAAKSFIREAARLMTRVDSPMEPRAALRRAGGTNEPEPGEAASPSLIAELDAAKARIVTIEREAEARRIEIEATEHQRQALETERDAARVSEAEAREKVAAGARLVFEAQEKVIEAKREAGLAWATVRRIRTMRGIKGRLARWIADVRTEDPDG